MQCKIPVFFFICVFFFFFFFCSFFSPNMQCKMHEFFFYMWPLPPPLFFFLWQLKKAKNLAHRLEDYVAKVSPLTWFFLSIFGLSIRYNCNTCRQNCFLHLNGLIDLIDLKFRSVKRLYFLRHYNCQQCKSSLTTYLHCNYLNWFSVTHRYPFLIGCLKQLSIIFANYHFF